MVDYEQHLITAWIGSKYPVGRIGEPQHVAISAAVTHGFANAVH
jgi:hypothetical protein